MIQIDERTDTGTATRFECGVWRVHPIMYFGLGQRRSVNFNAPFDGVFR